ncbi:MAG TPA: hypothetical protein VHX19_22905 [Stellaceae bacterium]|jgi:acyl-coenzyme A synthetase/AMP-(fatty) acid ligase|nr:hypothetical protein [Stellaceae bacterium]
MARSRRWWRVPASICAISASPRATASTSKVEAALTAHPLVADAAVIGVPISATAHEMVAFVVPRGALGHDEIVRHCRSRLPPDRLPDRIYYPNDLPRIAGSKVNRQRLLEIAAEERVKQIGTP